MDIDELYKIILMGDPCVGKTNLLSRFTKNNFIHKYAGTVGVEFATRDVQIDNKIIRLQIWETGGTERYRAIPSSMYRNAVGAIIVYDITNITTFQNAVKKWIRELRDYTKDRDVVIMLVGNKTDLSQKRAVRTDDVKEFAKTEKMLCMETSALDSSNVNNSFKKLVSQIYLMNIKKIDFGYDLRVPEKDTVAKEHCADELYKVIFIDEEYVARSNKCKSCGHKKTLTNHQGRRSFAHNNYENKSIRVYTQEDIDRMLARQRKEIMDELKNVIVPLYEALGKPSPFPDETDDLDKDECGDNEWIEL